MKQIRYLTRWLEGPLRKYLRQFPVVGLMGPRQSGKSTLLLHLFGSTYRYISFDSLAVRERALEDPELFLDEAGDQVILDEIQYVPSLLSALKIRVDRRRQAMGRYILTGSQQFALMKGLTETLAGRIGLLTLLPFSGREELEAKGQTAVAEKLFALYALRGGFPEMVARRGLDPGAWFDSYINTYLERDVRGLHQVGHLREFRRFLELLASRVGQVFNMSDFSREIGVSVPTIRQWTSILEASWIITLLPPYYRNFGKRISKSPKLYFLDTALAAHLVGITTQPLLFRGPMAGALFENYVISEILKQFLHRGRRPRLYYWRTSGGLEVDLLIEEKGELFPVECKLSKTIRRNMAKPLEQFLSLSHSSKGSAALVSLQGESFPLTRKVSAYNLLDYLSKLR